MRGSNCKQLNHGIEMNRPWGLPLLHIRILSARHCQQDVYVSECFRGAAWGHLVMDRQQRFEHGSQPTHAHLGCVPNEGNQARNSNLLQFLNWGLVSIGSMCWDSKWKEQADDHQCRRKGIDVRHIKWHEIKRLWEDSQVNIWIYMNKVSHFVWWGCLRSLSPEYAQEAGDSCLHMQLLQSWIVLNPIATEHRWTTLHDVLLVHLDSNCMDCLALPIVNSLNCLHFCI